MCDEFVARIVNAHMARITARPTRPSTASSSRRRRRSSPTCPTRGDRPRSRRAAAGAAATRVPMAAETRRIRGRDLWTAPAANPTRRPCKGRRLCEEGVVERRVPYPPLRAGPQRLRGRTNTTAYGRVPGTERSEFSTRLTEVDPPLEARCETSITPEPAGGSTSVNREPGPPPSRLPWVAAV